MFPVPSIATIAILNDGTVVPQNASIFVLSYSKYSGYLKVNAITTSTSSASPAPLSPMAFTPSVKRYADASL